MISQNDFERLIQGLKEKKPFLFSVREDGTLEINLFVLQEVLKQLGYHLDYNYYWDMDAYCVDTILQKQGKHVYRSTICKDGVSKENMSFDSITAMEISLLEAALTKIFKEFFKLNL